MLPPQVLVIVRLTSLELGFHLAKSLKSLYMYYRHPASLVGCAENEVNVWDRLIQAQSAKKVQLIHVNSGRNQNSGPRSCSNGALRIGT